MPSVSELVALHRVDDDDNICTGRYIRRRQLILEAGGDESSRVKRLPCGRERVFCLRVAYLGGSILIERRSGGSGSVEKTDRGEQGGIGTVASSNGLVTNNGGHMYMHTYACMSRDVFVAEGLCLAAGVFRSRQPRFVGGGGNELRSRPAAASST